MCVWGGGGVWLKRKNAALCKKLISFAVPVSCSDYIKSAELEFVFFFCFFAKGIQKAGVISFWKWGCSLPRQCVLCNLLLPRREPQHFGFLFFFKLLLDDNICHSRPAPKGTQWNRDFLILRVFQLELLLFFFFPLFRRGNTCCASVCVFKRGRYFTPLLQRSLFLKYKSFSRSLPPIWEIDGKKKTFSF